MQERIVILGAGESGVGAALLAQAKGFAVFVSDFGTILPKYKSVLSAHQIPYEQGRHSTNLILSATEVIKSPGIPDSAPILVALRKAGIPVIGEIEFAARYTNAKMLAITGTNGKTTTTLLLYHLLKESGLSVGLAGNVGYSLARQVMDDKFDFYVLELSSFQLDTLFDFKADVAILLNITPDHLDRYDYDFDKYTRSKFRITNNMLPDDHFVYFCDDDVIRNYLKKHPADMNNLPVSLTKSQVRGAFMDDHAFEFRTGLSPDFRIKSADIPIYGSHNKINAMAAILAASMIGIGHKAIRKALKTFKNADHRLEEVGSFNDILFVNDSKATNVEATFYALEAFDRPIIWIAGGTDKGNDYSKLKALARKNVKALICLGLDNEKLKEAFGAQLTNLQETKEMEDAVKKSFKLAENGDVILLSPACASFDLFKNYEERGKKFKKAVKNIMLNKREVV
ncbi:UDP-N-acetylmuramoyl-L-alanine--D-glutamate ligase [Fulvivirgaceae bacterium BMA12]|uniref:UDP-N-acetylmuramoylalanine--D-glutamate ligase n=1 Tax=Agaribacillus aureus TaxID=3051825 RepID=A0ABT8L1E5_9BACT|nr:UDP-N-acetylmuramoyl-L-alanine--D-glutamate ligase [Fulvivirgaceae bacterium BMA12]